MTIQPGNGNRSMTTDAGVHAEPASRTPRRRRSVIASMVPLGLVASFYVWTGVVSTFVSVPPTVDRLPQWLQIWGEIAGLPLIGFIIPPLTLSLVSVCLAALFFRRWRAPATAFLLSATLAVSFVVGVDPGGWFAWFLD